MRASRNASTLAIIIFACFQLLSFGILPLVAISTITAAVTFVTAPGGLHEEKKRTKTNSHPQSLLLKERTSCKKERKHAHAYTAANLRSK